MATKTLNATCVITLTETSIELLKKMQLHAEIPEGAKYIAFLEDGDACFLESIETGGYTLRMPYMGIFTYYTDIPVEFQE